MDAVLLARALRSTTVGGIVDGEMGAFSKKGVSGAARAPRPFEKRRRCSWGNLRRRPDAASMSGERLRGEEGEVGFERNCIWLWVGAAKEERFNSKPIDLLAG